MPVADGSIIIDTAIDSRSAKGDLDSLMAKFRNTANQAGAIGKKLSNSVEKSFSSFSKASAKLGELDNRIAQLRRQIASMKETPVKTSAFSDLEKEIEQTKEKLAKVDAQKQRFLASGGKEDSTAFQRMEYDANQLSAQLDRLLAKKSEMETRGEAYTTPDTTALEEQLNSLMERRVQLANDLGINYDGVKNKIADASGKMAQMQEKERQASDTGNAIKKKFDEVANSIQKAARSSGGLGGGFKNLLKTVLRYGFAIRSAYILVNKLKQFTKEGLKNMALYSSTTNSAISSMLTALNTLKNSLGAAFAPIVETVAPYITSLINMIASAVTAVNQFISALLGRSTYTKAIAVQQDYAKSLGGTAAAADKAASGSDKAGKAAKKAAKEQEKFLAGFDEIEKIPDSSDSSGGSGSGGGGGGGSGGGGGTGEALQFVTESIPGLVTNWADMLREAWEKADFTEIGGIIGAKLRDALDSIPWDTIKDTAKRVAKSLATLLNGFIETEGLSQSIGHTIAEAFNTGFEFVNTFLENFHFDSFGRFITSGIQAALETFEWSQIGRTVSNLLTAALDFGQGALDGVRWDDLGGTIWTALKDTITNINYAKISEKFFKLLGTAIQDSRNLIGGFFGSIAADITDWATDDTGKVDFEKIAKAYWGGLKKALEVAKPASDFLSDLNIPNPLTDIVKTWETVDLVEEILKPLKDKGLADSFGEVASGIVDGFKTAFNNLPAYVEGVIEGIKKYLSGLKIDINPFDGDGVGIKEDISLTAAITGELVKLEDKVPADQKKIDNAQANVDRMKDNLQRQDKTLDGGTLKTSSLDKSGLSSSDKTATGGTLKASSIDKSGLSSSDKTATGGTLKASKLDKGGLSSDEKTVGGGTLKASKLNKGGIPDKSKTVGGITAKATKFKDAIKQRNKTITVTIHYRKTYSTRGRSGTSSGGRFAKGGVLQHGVWRSIPQYAGGSLSAGSMFVAGERGPEVVGHIGGRTEVLNKSQIASAIYQAMVSAMAKMGGYFSRMTSALANIPTAIQTMSMTQPDFVLEIPQMATGTVLPPQATISTQDAAMLREAIVGLTTALQGAQASGRHGTTQNNITLELPGVGVLGRAMVKYIDGEAKQGRYPLSGYM